MHEILIIPSTYGYSYVIIISYEYFLNFRNTFTNTTHNNDNKQYHNVINIVIFI